MHLGETIKILAIVLLILLAGLLTAMISSYGGAEAFLGNLQTSPMDAIPVSTERKLADGSQPTLISLKSDQGRASFYGDFLLLDGAYEALGSFLAQALDTAENPVALQKDSFYTTVASDKGIYFQFPATVALSTLTLWLDGETDLDFSGYGYFLQAEEDTVRLFVESDQAYYSMMTEVDGQALQHVLEGYATDGSNFAWERELETLYPLTVLSSQPNQVLAATVENPLDSNFLLEVASDLLFNPYGESQYMDEQGGTVFTESDCTLRVGLDGQLTLENWEGTNRFLAASGAQVDQIDYASDLLGVIFAEVAGEERVMYTGYQVDGDINRIYFDYFLGGIPVTDGNGHSIVAEFQGKTLLSLTASVRCYTTVAETYLTYLPVEQAAALVPEGQQMVLAYGDLTGDALSVGWIS